MDIVLLLVVGATSLCSGMCYGSGSSEQAKLALSTSVGGNLTQAMPTNAIPLVIGCMTQPEMLRPGVQDFHEWEYQLPEKKK